MYGKYEKINEKYRKMYGKFDVENRFVQRTETCIRQCANNGLIKFKRESN